MTFDQKPIPATKFAAWTYPLLCANKANFEDFQKKLDVFEVPVFTCRLKNHNELRFGLYLIRPL